ncbi:DegT/DnrJ/EryC1/StrS family aminotransferase [Enterovibrio norvegicus]|uniref:dTDP-4-amino-4,6-dideoxygalactose transaminase n=1 Tax=Enterovibrio norvegicus DSM 15893 TaxID=1121869 RepID=A0A1I5JEE1_9GAMM|nr:DegT/DnrJ/EryC1/StrS aminotransferase family protein [Enterovibrio norvegicus]SFO71165.1 dTDP-4-amino-4,6-dideoxygalactose transaminase [Enterovibrio norvegicus DSM 15893]
MLMFKKSFTQQMPIPEGAIASAVEVMRTGRLHRYNTLDGELSETDLLEKQFADYLDVKYCLSCASGGYAIYIALLCVGVKAGEKVLCNAFTLAPVPGAITNAGGEPVLVETTADLTIDLNDLARKASQPDVRYLLLSHMRGHVADMNAIVDICDSYGVTLIEDCAHTMGAKWRGKASGTFGKVACFSAQTYKHINAGEGGFLVTNDDGVMAKAIIYSGSYMLFDQHPTLPPKEWFDEVACSTPNYSGRMDNLRAAILRPQLARLDRQCKRWNSLYAAMEDALSWLPGVVLTKRSDDEVFVGSSIQFSFPDLPAEHFPALVRGCQRRGVALKWVGAPEPSGYSSKFNHWQYLAPSAPLPQTEKVLSTLIDMRIPLTFEESDAEVIAQIISDVLKQTQ